MAISETLILSSANETQSILWRVDSVSRSTKHRLNLALGTLPDISDMYYRALVALLAAAKSVYCTELEAELSRIASSDICRGDGIGETGTAAQRQPLLLPDNIDLTPECGTGRAWHALYSHSPYGSITSVNVV